MFLKCLHIINIWTILLSTVGVASYRHYCQEELKAVSFFADLIVPCCKPQKVKKRTIKSCCAARKSCRLKNSHHLTTNLEKGTSTPSFQKRNCCLDKSDFAQADVETNLKTGSGEIATLLAIIPFDYIQRIPVTTDYELKNKQEPAYAWLCFYPPPNTPLYIQHQSFLC
ncbi:HYC_CC_PP family protein [Aureispira anguillae]|uniref:Uncharacterized protein n=1 Tax=Aureispira anguillae TaxID=2864201 RepID=A0A915YAX2_9BACT|nr:hypothetical protein [Aureispira anguillae]BDS09435.1 hypothetical protein AsAng_0001330 [Aureispira anguillae]